MYITEFFLQRHACGACDKCQVCIICIFVFCICMQEHNLPPLVPDHQILKIPAQLLHSSTIIFRPQRILRATSTSTICENCICVNLCKMYISVHPVFCSYFIKSKKCISCILKSVQNALHKTKVHGRWLRPAFCISPIFLQ